MKLPRLHNSTNGMTHHRLTPLEEVYINVCIYIYKQVPRESCGASVVCMWPAWVVQGIGMGLSFDMHEGDIYL